MCTEDSKCPKAERPELPPIGSRWVLPLERDSRITANAEVIGYAKTYHGGGRSILVRFDALEGLVSVAEAAFRRDAKPIGVHLTATLRQVISWRPCSEGLTHAFELAPDLDTPVDLYELYDKGEISNAEAVWLLTMIFDKPSCNFRGSGKIADYLKGEVLP